MVKYSVEIQIQSLGQGAIPYRRYSPRALRGMTWCDSRADSIVWMRKDLCVQLFCVHFGLLRSFFNALFYFRQSVG